MKVREIMSEDIACCTPDTGLQEVAQMMVECDCGSVPVVQDEESKKLLGIITDRDMVVRAVAKGMNPLELTARDCMSTDIQTVTPETSVEECCQVMEEYQVRRVPVVERGGICCGIVAQADIALEAPGHETAEVVRDVSRPMHV